GERAAAVPLLEEPVADDRDEIVPRRVGGVEQAAGFWPRVEGAGGGRRHQKRPQLFGASVHLERQRQASFDGEGVETASLPGADLGLAPRQARARGGRR